MKKATIYLAVIGIVACFVIAPIGESTLILGNPPIDQQSITSYELFGLASEYAYAGSTPYGVILQKSYAWAYYMTNNTMAHNLTPNNIPFPGIQGELFDGFDDVAVGDFDGDGHDDVVISDYLYSNSIVPTPSLTGRIWVWKGPDYDQNDVFEIDGVVTNAYFGFSMDAGDFDGDGYDDLIISAPGMSSMAGNGEVYIYWGSDDYDVDTSMDGWENALFNPMTIQPDVLSGFDDIGWCVRNVGDLDDDRDDEEETPYYDDFIITNIDETYSTIYNIGVFYGNTRNSISSTPDDHLTSALWYHGADVDSGDINGDGYNDIVTGYMIHVRDERRTGMGATIVVYPGSSTGVSNNNLYVGSCNDDPYTDEHTYDIACFGDENIDGYDDVLLSRPNTDEEGIVYGWNGMSDLGDLEYPDWYIEGLQTDELFGYYRPLAGRAMCGIPDTDNDQRDEALIGSPYWDDVVLSTTDSGKIGHYIYN